MDLERAKGWASVASWVVSALALTASLSVRFSPESEEMRAVNRYQDPLFISRVEDIVEKEIREEDLVRRKDLDPLIEKVDEVRRDVKDLIRSSSRKEE